MTSPNSPALAELTDLANTLTDIGGAMALLGWDQEVLMPPKGGEGRAYQLATLAGIYHEKFTAPRTGELLTQLGNTLAERDGFSPTQRALVREMRRDYDIAVKVPGTLIKALTEAESRGVETWRKAREVDDFDAFVPALERLLDLKRQAAEYIGYTDSPYDALLDQYEPGMTARAIQDLFDPLREQTIAIFQAIQASSVQVDMHVLDGEWDEQKQWDFGLIVLRDMGYDFEAGRQDKSTHPFTSSSTAPYDVRVTTRVDRTLLTSALFTTIHEGGHALYELGFDPALARTPLANSPSLGMHESQSRSWENMVGRSRAFWTYYFPLLVATFPDQLTLDDFERFLLAINQVQPSLIRVEADEVTYNLHVILRFELEKALLEGSLRVTDLPDAWNAKMQAYLGITPPSNALGVLQDIHWGTGLIGYFPTYTLGNLIAAQLVATIREQTPDFDARLERGDLRFFLDWNREHIHRHGRVYTATELVERATGRPLDPAYFSQYIRAKYGAMYHLE